MNRKLRPFLWIKIIIVCVIFLSLYNKNKNSTNRFVKVQNTHSDEVLPKFISSSETLEG